MDKNKNETIETVMIGNTAYDVADLTPTIYFDYVKDKKKDIEDENLQAVAENCLTILKRLKVTGQTEMAKEIVNKYELTMRELKAASFGFDKVIYRSDMDKFVDKISHNPVKVRELEKYKREIPDDVIDRLIVAKENDLFDQYYVIFTDYTGKEEKKVAKERREKDPILFGAFITKDKYKIPEERLFYIADWIDEYCDLTMDEMIKQYEKSEKQGLVYGIDMPKDVDGLKEYFSMLEKKDPKKATCISKLKEKLSFKDLLKKK